MLAGRVAEIGQQDEAQRRVGVGEAVDLQALEQERNVRSLRYQHRHDDRRRAVGGNPGVEIELFQSPGWDQERQQPLRQGRAGYRGREGGRQHAEKEGRRRGADLDQVEERHRERCGERQGEQGGVQSPGVAEQRPPPADRGRPTVGDIGLEARRSLPVSQ